jgi:hypothetical protein
MRNGTIRFFLTSFIFLCFSSVLAVPARAAAPTAEKADLLNETLLKKFQAVGSFEANYIGTKQGAAKSLRLHVLFASQNKYQLLELYYDSTSQQPDAIFILGYHDAPVYTFISPKDGRAFQLSYKDLVENRSHPFGVVLAAIQETYKKGQRGPFQVDDVKVFPSLGIELSEKSVNADTGMSADGVNLSWLDKDRLLHAQDITETEAEFIITYSPTHTVRIDKQTGLLIEDSWLMPDKSERKLVLDKFTKIKKDKPYDDYGSLYKKIPITEDMTSGIWDKFYMAFLTSMADSLNKDKDFDAFLAKDAGNLRKSSRKISKNYWLKVRIEEIRSKKEEEQKTVEFIEQALVPLYKEVVKKTDHGISFKQFVQECRQDDEFMDLLLKKVGSSDSSPDDSAKYDKYLAALPDGSRKPLLRLLDIVKKDVTAGMELAYIDAIFDYAENHPDIGKRQL